ncbi:MAG: response regulator [Thermodesulfovibrionales bacterium]|nr:response regulator [Thermodesulfovibrionales bacterium]
MKVLVVDDEQLVRWFLERALKKWGHEVVPAPSSQEALALLGSTKFDVLFTDLRMPEGNGAQLIKQVSDMPNKCSRIVVCSAFITSEMARDFESKNILTLKKPFKLNELESVLARCEEDSIA